MFSPRHALLVSFSTLETFEPIQQLQYTVGIYYRASGSTAGRHCSPVAFSSRWKHYLATAAVALETWSLALPSPHSSPLASLSALLLAIRMKTSGGPGCLEMQSPIKYFQIAMLLQATSALYIINHAPGSYVPKILHSGYYVDELPQNPCFSILYLIFLLTCFNITNSPATCLLVLLQCYFKPALYTYCK